MTKQDAIIILKQVNRKIRNYNISVAIDMANKALSWEIVEDNHKAMVLKKEEEDSLKYISDDK